MHVFVRGGGFVLKNLVRQLPHCHDGSYATVYFSSLADLDGGPNPRMTIFIPNSEVNNV
jgi:hypothetical protein